MTGVDSPPAKVVVVPVVVVMQEEGEVGSVVSESSEEVVGSSDIVRVKLLCKCVCCVRLLLCEGVV